jgi:large subunit ribosomal protein L33
MAKKTGPRTWIKMASTESSHRFTTTKNKRNNPERLELKRYDPVLKRHVLFNEEK